jgi:RNA polymerase sigma factor (sigma-70 family)
MFWLRFEQGRLDEVQAIMEASVAGHPELPVTKSLLALLYSELDHTRANEVMDEYSATGFEGLPWGAVGPIAPLALSYATARLGRAADAAALYDRLKPFQGHLAVAGTATLCLGPFDHYLGMLAACCGQWSEADTHYNAALSLEQGTGSTAMLARTRLWQAKALAERGIADDQTRARRIAAAALTDARDLGMGGVAREAQDVLDHLSRLDSLELLGAGVSRRRYQSLAAFHSASAEQQAIDSDDQAQVAAAIRTLTPRQRECVILRYWDGLTDEEIAATLGLSVNSVKTHLRRGLAALENRLETPI